VLDATLEEDINSLLKEFVELYKAETKQLPLNKATPAEEKAVS